MSREFNDSLSFQAGITAITAMIETGPGDVDC